MAVTRTSSGAGLVKPLAMDGFTRLASSPYFLVDRFSLKTDATQPLGEEEKLQILIALGDGCELQSQDGATLALPRGNAVVLPVAGRAFSLKASNALDVVRVLQP